MIHTGVAPKMEFSSVFIQKFISSPKCRFRECSWRGIGKNARSAQTTPESWSIWLKILQETQFISENEFVLGWHTRGPQ